MATIIRDETSKIPRISEEFVTKEWSDNTWETLDCSTGESGGTLFRTDSGDEFATAAMESTMLIESTETDKDKSTVTAIYYGLDTLYVVTTVKITNTLVSSETDIDLERDGW